MSELYELSAVDTLRAFRDGSVSPSDYLEAILDRIEVAQPVVNALGDQYVEEARAAARAAGERYARGDARPLEGLPVAIKDEAAIAASARRTARCSCRTTSPIATIRSSNGCVPPGRS